MMKDVVERLGFIIDTDWEAWENGDTRSVVLFTDESYVRGLQKVHKVRVEIIEEDAKSPYLKAGLA